MDLVVNYLFALNKKKKREKKEKKKKREPWSNKTPNEITIVPVTISLVCLPSRRAEEKDKIFEGKIHLEYYRTWNLQVS